MNKFKDLKVGDVIFVGFAKKVIHKIKNDYPLHDNILFYTLDGEYYSVCSYLSSDYDH